MVLIENENHGRCAVRGDSIREISCCRWLEAIGENLDVTQHRSCASQLLTEIANYLRLLAILLQAFEHDIPAVRVAHGRLEQLVAHSAHDHQGWRNPKRSQRCGMQIHLGIGNRFASPQPRECPRATIEARESIGKGWEGNAKSLMIEASEPIRASAESYLEASAAGRLGDGELRRQEEWVA